MSESRSFYDILGVGRTATPDEIKKAYRRLVLSVHPDRVHAGGRAGDPAALREAHENFLQLQRVYETLIDEEKRAYYDETGKCLDEGQHLVEESTLDALHRFFRTCQRRITEEDIVAFEAKYRNSDMEREDVLNHYRNFCGKVEHLIDHIPYSDESDISRFIQILDDALSKGELERTPAYAGSRKTLLGRAKRSTHRARKPGKSERNKFAALQEAIISKREDRATQLEALCDRIAAKYAAVTGPNSTTAKRGRKERKRSTASK
ncbi:similar to DnaJ homolog [Cyanidioschyzon merolae strain 10D]|uniref:Similar to DnaJ homolog n=1 Tax=Cyanidioschyzon merolae (strain NIES-3377 / 10D) TaxID=280699 RepID=M1UVR1_CYAM1|nr:similar to DnaJ homolog [Cyanidioschyzon merolae strain 10D]BAM82126.1 similar to DnaJ homolog [Cyanidioschyzon merolae strain 10D]|eukprot:XP_005538162.1 similar to DnaJ homolog [Cyanidioschyzon merolae strain 10D]